MRVAPAEDRPRIWGTAEASAELTCWTCWIPLLQRMGHLLTDAQQALARVRQDPRITVADDPRLAPRLAFAREDLAVQGDIAVDAPLTDVVLDMGQFPLYDPRKKRRILPAGTHANNRFGLPASSTGGVLRFHCDSCHTVETWSPVQHRGEPLGLHLFRQRLRRPHGHRKPVYPKRPSESPRGGSDGGRATGSA